ncbi:MAG: glycosyltransferase family 4 protein [Bryobacteraceae bacterium]|nr:glycosyltransferase family 4 protein [Bryobacteraceae bacterium]
MTTGSTGIEWPVSVILISYFFPPVVGGAEIHGQRLAGALLAHGHSVRVLCSGGDPMPAAERWIDARGTPVRAFGSRWPSSWRGRVFALNVAWTLLKDRRTYDIAHFLLGGLQVLIGLPLARFLGKGTVTMFGGSGDLRELEATAVGRLELRVLRRFSSRVIALNPAMVREFTELGVSPDRIVTLPCEVDPADFRPCDAEERRRLRRELGLAADAGVVVFTGRFVPSKRLSLLVAGFARLAPRRPSAKLILVGDGPARPEVVERIREAGLESRVVLAGMAGTERVRQWLQASDVFALVSSEEGIPCSLIEAMAVGLPSLVTDIPAMSQLIEHGVNGIRVPVDDEQAVARELNRLLEDPAWRAKLGAAGRESVREEYSIEHVARRYEMLYRQLRDESLD